MLPMENRSVADTDVLTRELLALSADVRGRKESAIVSRVTTLVRLGATRDDVQEALSAAVMKGGRRSLGLAIEALAAFDKMTSIQEVRVPA
jgi:alkylhydroperoxidase/carboxymuconolactone decarboxylase family protein YurZ